MTLFSNRSPAPPSSAPPPTAVGFQCHAPIPHSKNKRNNQICQYNCAVAIAL
jgi:hypothetical protein